MKENRFERRVFEGRTVDIARNPIIVKDRGTLPTSISQKHGTGGGEHTRSSWYM
jgi:hypothetical protein